MRPSILLPSLVIMIISYGVWATPDLWAVGGAGGPAAQTFSGFVVGEHLEIVVMFPSPGYVGTPYTMAGIPPIRLPKSEDAFKKVYVRVTVADQRPLPNGQRIVLRVDTIDEHGEIDEHSETVAKGTCFAYIDLIPGQAARLYSKKEDDGRNEDKSEIGPGEIWHAIPFPLWGAIPPSVMFEKGKSIRYVPAQDRGGLGQIVQQKAKQPDGGSDTEVRVETTLFRPTLEYGTWKPPADAMIMYFDPTTQQLESKEATGRVQVEVVAKIAQVWPTANDWLWSEMNLYDGHGHITLKCKRVKLDVPTKPEGTAPAAPGGTSNRP